jgi:hypothetical protein
VGEYITDVLDNGIGKFLLFAHHKDPRGEREADRKLVNLSHLFHLSTQRENLETNLSTFSDLSHPRPGKLFWHTF